MKKKNKKNEAFIKNLHDSAIDEEFRNFKNELMEEHTRLIEEDNFSDAKKIIEVLEQTKYQIDDILS